MAIRKRLALLFLSMAFCLFYITGVLAQTDDSAEPTTASSVADASLPWGAQRILPAKVPAEFNQTFDKILAEGGGKLRGGAREVLAWEGNYKNRSKTESIKTELKANLRKEGWEYESLGREGDVELFSLVKEVSSMRRAVLGFFVASDEVFVCALMEIQKADASPTQGDSPAISNSGTASGSGIVGKWFRTTGGSTIDWTGKTTLKGGEDFTFEFFADGTVRYTRKKEILNIMQCRINSLDDASGRYTLSGATLTINLGAMKSIGSNSCNAKENYNKTLGDSTMTVRIQIKQMEDITRPDKPYIMCLDGNQVCYEKQR